MTKLASSLLSSDDDDDGNLGSRSSQRMQNSRDEKKKKKKFVTDVSPANNGIRESKLWMYDVRPWNGSFPKSQIPFSGSS